MLFARQIRFPRNPLENLGDALDTVLIFTVFGRQQPHDLVLSRRCYRNRTPGRKTHGLADFIEMSCHAAILLVTSETAGFVCRKMARGT